MAITTLDQTLAGMQAPVSFYKVGTTMGAAGVLFNPWYSPGYPGAAASPTATVIAGLALTSYAGQLPFTNPGVGNSYLARFGAAASISGTLLLVDRLWHNGSIAITTTTPQTVTSPAFPARDAGGTTNGVGVFIGLEVYGTIGTGSPVTNTTISYTNSAGTAGQTGTIASVPTGATTGTFIPVELAAGDVGVRAIASLTLGTSYVSGTVGLVAYRVLGRVDLNLPNSGNAIDSLTGGFPRIFDNSVLHTLFLPSATTATKFYGSYTVTQG